MVKGEVCKKSELPADLSYSADITLFISVEDNSTSLNPNDMSVGGLLVPLRADFKGHSFLSHIPWGSLTYYSCI